MRFRSLFIVILALLIASGWIASLVVSAQSDAPQPGSPHDASITNKSSASAQAFVMYRNAQGEATCRAATPSERKQIMQRRGDKVVIYAGAPRRDANGRNTRCLKENCPICSHQLD